MPTGTEQEYKRVYKLWHDSLTKQNPPLVFSQSAPAYFAEAANLTDWYSVMGWVREYGQVSSLLLKTDLRFDEDFLRLL